MTKILVVDDDSEMTKLLDTFLTGEGHEVLIAQDGGAAVRATSSMEPDLVLLDIVLGTEDGRDVLRELRLISDVPVIFLTGRGLESERIAGLKLGAEDDVQEHEVRFHRRGRSNGGATIDGHQDFVTFAG